MLLEQTRVEVFSHRRFTPAETKIFGGGGSSKNPAAARQARRMALTAADCRS